VDVYTLSTLSCYPCPHPLSLYSHPYLLIIPIAIHVPAAPASSPSPFPAVHSPNGLGLRSYFIRFTFYISGSGASQVSTPQRMWIVPNNENTVSGRHKRNNTIEEKKLLGGGRRGNIGRGPGRNSELEGRGRIGKRKEGCDI